jgi:hypothetical protein
MLKMRGMLAIIAGLFGAAAGFFIGTGFQSDGTNWTDLGIGAGLMSMPAFAWKQIWFPRLPMGAGTISKGRGLL